MAGEHIPEPARPPGRRDAPYHHEGRGVVCRGLCRPVSEDWSVGPLNGLLALPKINNRCRDSSSAVADLKAYRHQLVESVRLVAADYETQNRSLPKFVGADEIALLYNDAFL